jgi:hypothetical protein
MIIVLINRTRCHIKKKDFKNGLGTSVTRSFFLTVRQNSMILTNNTKLERFILTAEQSQRLLFGDYYNGLDQPLKTVLQVKINRAWAAQNSNKLK